MGIFSFLTSKLPVDTQQIEQAISHLEQQTSAELRVVVERKAQHQDALARATELFNELEMDKTAQRNAVLIYLAFKPHLMAVIGDEGIHQKVGDEFWQSVYAAMKTQAQRGEYTSAICEGIAQVAVQLAEHFPRLPDDINELDNRVVIK